MKALNIDRKNTYKEGVALPTNVPHIIEIKSADAMIWDDAEKKKRMAKDNELATELWIYFDICEGEFKGYYKEKYDNSQDEDAKWKGILKIYIPKEDGSEQDDWTIKSFNGNINAVEASNPGYLFDWDEKKLVGKKAAMVFRQKEWCFNGRAGFFAEPYKMISIDDAKAGRFKEPKIKYLPEGTISTSSDAINNFVSVNNKEAEEVPFL